MEQMLVLPDTTDRVFSQLLDIVSPINEIEGWIKNSHVGTQLVYTRAKYLMDGGHNQRLQRIFWIAYEKKYVLLFQRRIKTQKDVFYDYIAVRTGKPFIDMRNK